MANINPDTFRDKVLGCWAGKNIGGTLGGPFETKPGPFNISFYTHKLDGQPLPNDDLDLQLVWLGAMEKHFSPYHLTPRIMGQLWYDHIIGPWNEYAVCVKNISRGFYPPLSGVVDNDHWKWSNGAWIRSEIWACCFPGSPDEAIQFAWLDACCDHCGEGIFAEMFTAALESAAFVEDDIQTLIDIALARIPADSRIARAVGIALQYYHEGKTWLEAREALLKDSEDIGPLQAPCNVAFAVVGLLWGEGDLGKTVCTAVNCGDDTDCTAATAGAVLGILKGFSGLPEKWLKPIGMGIRSISFSPFGDIYPELPKNLQELTDRVFNIAWQTSVYNPRLPKFLKDSAGFTAEERERLKVPEYPGGYDKSGGTVAELLWKRPSTEMVYQLDWIKMYVKYPDDPEFVPGQPFRITVRFYRGTKRVNNIRISWRLPDGWICEPLTQYLFITLSDGEEVSCDLLPPEDAGSLDYPELIVGRDGHCCDDVIRLPMQRKGSSHAKLQHVRPNVYDYGLINTLRTKRKPDQEPN